MVWWGGVGWGGVRTHVFGSLGLHVCMVWAVNSCHVRCIVVGIHKCQVPIYSPSSLLPPSPSSLLPPSPSSLFPPFPSFLPPPSLLPPFLLHVTDREQQELIKAARTIQTAFRKYTVSATPTNPPTTPSHPTVCLPQCLCVMEVPYSPHTQRTGGRGVGVSHPSCLPWCSQCDLSMWL